MGVRGGWYSWIKYDLQIFFSRRDWCNNVWIWIIGEFDMDEDKLIVELKLEVELFKSKRLG